MPFMTQHEILGKYGLQRETDIGFISVLPTFNTLSQTQFSHLYNRNSNIGLRRWVESCPSFYPGFPTPWYTHLEYSLELSYHWWP